MSIRNDIYDALLADMDNIRTDGTTYADSDVKRLVSYQDNFENEFNDATPLLMVIDQGNDQTVQRDDGQTRYTFDIAVWGYVARHNWDRTRQELNGITADVKKWVDSEPSIHSQMLALNYVEATSLQYDPVKQRGLVGITLAIIYYADNGTY